MVRAWWGECGHYWSGENGSTHSFVEDDEENKDIFAIIKHTQAQTKNTNWRRYWLGGERFSSLFNISISIVEQEGLFNEQLVKPKHKQDKHKQTIVGTIDPGENSSTLYFIIVIFSIHSIIYMKASSALKVEIRSTISRITWISTLSTVSCRALEVLKTIETCFSFVCVSWC